MFKQSLACICILLTLNVLTVSSSAGSYYQRTSAYGSYGSGIQSADAKAQKKHTWMTRLKWAGAAVAGAAVVAGTIAAAVMLAQQHNQINQENNQIGQLNNQLANSTAMTPEQIAYHQAQANQQKQQQAYNQAQAAAQQQQQQLAASQAALQAAQAQQRAYYEQQLAQIK